MYAVPLPRNADEDIFRDAARRCLALDLAPDVVSFVDETEPSLLSPIPNAPTSSKVSAFLERTELCFEKQFVTRQRTVSTCFTMCCGAFCMVKKRS